jgi:hypothetical protein
MSKIKKEFDKSVQAKVDFHNSKQGIKKLLRELFPTVMFISQRKAEDSVEKELDVMLSSAITIKTGQFWIPVTNRYSEKMSLSRKPGLRFPHLSGRNYEWRETVTICENGNLEGNISSRGYYSYGTKRTEGPPTLSLSVLKNDKHIDQQKFTDFYGYLAQFLKILDGKSKELSDDDRDDKTRFRKGELIMLTPRDQGFQLFVKYTDSEGKIESAEIRSSELYNFGLTSYSGDYYDTEEKIKQEDFKMRSEWRILETLQHNFNQVIDMLTAFETIKNGYVNQLNSLFKEINDANKAFRLMNKLASND